MPCEFSRWELPPRCRRRPRRPCSRHRPDVWGIVSVCLVCPTVHCLSARTALRQESLTRGAPPHPSLSLLPPVFLISLVVCEIALCFAHRFETATQMLRRVHHILPFGSFRGHVCFLNLCLLVPAPRLLLLPFSIRMSLFGAPVVAVLKCLGHMKALGFVLLCFACSKAQNGADVKLRADFPSEFLVARR